MEAPPVEAPPVEAPPVFKNATEIAQAAVSKTRKKTEIAQAVIEALGEHDALAPWPGETFTVRLNDDDVKITRTEWLPGGVEVEYWGETPVSYHFPAGATVQILSGPAATH